jgi:uncharacterized protein YjbI with pentapeptide repeats
MNYSNLTLSDNENVLFDKINATNGYFHEMKTKNIYFENTDLTSAQFYNTKLKDIDLTSCIINGLGANIEDVKGLIINEMQIIELAYLLGVEFKS